MRSHKPAAAGAGVALERGFGTTSNPSLRSTLCIALGVAAMAVGSASAAVPSSGAAAPAPEPDQICRDTVGLAPGGRAFADCVDDLSQSAASLKRGANLDQARENCRGRRVQPSGQALAVCEVAATDDEASSDPHRDEVRVALTAKPKITSYFNVSWREAHQRQRMACATLGFSPEGAGFYSCVASLQATLFRAGHPSN